jgi:hypothetical protein
MDANLQAIDLSAYHEINAAVSRQIDYEKVIFPS